MARLTTTKSYDNLNRLLNIRSTTNASAQPVFAYAYSYNDANQRTRVNLADGSFWIYDYDALGQVKSGKRYWSDWTPVAGQQFEYGFDDIGNRNSTKSGGDSSGGNLRLASYTNNSLNQITSRDVPAYLNVIGAATATATNVNVNDSLAYRKGEYYRVERNPDNSANPVWQSVTNRAVQSGTTNSVTGNAFLPRNPEVFGYDADGNLTNDGRWMLTWDAENRLIKAESQTSAPTTSKRKVEFTYDWRGGLIRRIEYNGSSGSYVVTNDLKFLNDSLHCIAELNGTNNALIRSYLWGLDLSGTMNGAGSVGGLLSLNSKVNGAHFQAYDGNGNVVALVNTADGSVSANYEYSSFGERLRATGPMAGENVYCFSTKRNDSVTDLVHYEYRTYKPSTGTWLSRDPIEEKGGLNLHLFVKNSPQNHFDRLGHKCCLLIYPQGSGPNGFNRYPHAALECDNGAYLSVYPSEEDVFTFQSPGEWRSKADDMGQYGQPTSTCFDCLDEGNVAGIVAEAQCGGGKGVFDGLTHNCSDFVRDAIVSSLPTQKKPDCPCTPWYLPNVFYVVTDLLESPLAASTPGVLAKQIEALAANKCNRYKCALKSFHLPN